jgi:hypothetical protein
MPTTAVRTYHKWSPSERMILRDCNEDEVRKFAQHMKLPFTAVYAQWRAMREENEKSTDMPTFDYSKIVPLKALFTRCPVCGGTTTVNKNAYCRSCLSQWHPITLEPMKGLHDADPW